MLGDRVWDWDRAIKFGVLGGRETLVVCMFFIFGYMEERLCLFASRFGPCLIFFFFFVVVLQLSVYHKPAPNVEFSPSKLEKSVCQKRFSRPTVYWSLFSFVSSPSSFVFFLFFSP